MATFTLWARVAEVGSNYEVTVAAVPLNGTDTVHAPPTRRAVVRTESAARLERERLVSELGADLVKAGHRVLDTELSG